ncbi:MAG: HEPN domain-containing protein [Bacteroides sp.]|nr:HEPN domain-containing protein [Bacteroides sp.]MCM1085060.1 HEPN domain-containing protein [Bacteroides sp.]
MKNSIANQAINDCNDELVKIQGQIEQLGSTNIISGFLTRYSLIKVCGTMEVCYKTIIADFYENSAPLLGAFISYHLRDSSMNAKYENICKALCMFDRHKEKLFKEKISILPEKDKVMQALSDLNSSRNTFAHRGLFSMSFNDLYDKFKDGVRILEVLDSILCEESS